MTDLDDSIATALGEYGDDYDTDAIAAAMRAAGCTTADDMGDAEFWALAAAHELPEEPPEPGPVERFRQEVVAAMRADRPLGEPAVWRRGGVTLEITGASRVNHRWPQVMAILRLTAIGGEERVMYGTAVASWEALWEIVNPALTSWAAAVEERREEYGRTQRAAEAAWRAASEAEAAAGRAAAALSALLPEKEHLGATMTQAQVAEYLGIAPALVRRRMSRWEIEATYVHGTSGRLEARYPTSDVQVAAARHPGQGHRTDLDGPDA